MKVLWMAGLLATIAALTIGLSKPERRGAQQQSAKTPKLVLHDERTSSSDLELSGDVPGAGPYTGRYVSYSELLRLPQVTFTVTDDANFRGAVELGGVPLEELMQALEIPEKNTLVGAVCDDGYEAHYLAAYRAAHHPFLVLTINGKAPALVKRSGEEGAYGPYLISHPKFVSRYQILGQGEEPQIPNGVIELRFLNQEEVLGAIRPRGNFAADSPQMQGYEIAQENCFRCHNEGNYGGKKAGITWAVLGKIARTRPKYFGAYIKDPQAESDYAEMPGFPGYDEAVLGALTAYFETMNAHAGEK